MKAFKGTDGMTEPREVECEEFGYPHYDSDHNQMFQNTHFRTEAEAWESIMKSVFAGVEIMGRRVEEARKRVRVAETEAADMTVEFLQARTKYAAWKARQ